AERRPERPSGWARGAALQRSACLSWIKFVASTAGVIRARIDCPNSARPCKSNARGQLVFPWFVSEPAARGSEGPLNGEPPRYARQLVRRRAHATGTAQPASTQFSPSLRHHRPVAWVTKDCALRSECPNENLADRLSSLSLAQIAVWGLSLQACLPFTPSRKDEGKASNFQPSKSSARVARAR